MKNSDTVISILCITDSYFFLASTASIACLRWVCLCL